MFEPVNARPSGQQWHVAPSAPSGPASTPSTVGSGFGMKDEYVQSSPSSGQKPDFGSHDFQDHGGTNDNFWFDWAHPDWGGQGSHSESSAGPGVSSNSAGFSSNSWNTIPSSNSGSTIPSASSYSAPSGPTGSTITPGNSGTVYGAATAGPNDPTIKLQNSSSTTRYYFIQASAGSDPEGLNGKVIAVPPGGTATVNPGAGFNGAITDNGTNSSAACLGTRYEINYSAGGTYYDADTQYGNTNGTIQADNGTGLLEGDGDLQHYINAGAYGSEVGANEDAAHKYSDASTQHVQTLAMTITSLNYKPGVDGGNDYTASSDPNVIYNVPLATGNGQPIV